MEPSDSVSTTRDRPGDGGLAEPSSIPAKDPKDEPYASGRRAPAWGLADSKSRNLHTQAAKKCGEESPTGQTQDPLLEREKMC